MKKLFPFLCGFSALFLIIIFTRPAWTSHISINSQSARTGDDVTFTVTIGPYSTALDAFGFDIHFNNSTLKYTGFSAGEITREFDFFDVSNLSDNVIRIGGIAINPLKINHSAELVYLNFTCLGCSEDKSLLKIYKKVDDMAKWNTQPGVFTCLGETQTAQTDTKQANQTETLRKTTGYIPRMHTSSNKDLPEKQKGYSSSVPSGNPPPSYTKESPLKQANENKKVALEKGTGKKPGLTVVYKEPSDKSPSKPPEQNTFDASALSASLSAKYGDIPSIKTTFPENGASSVPTDIPSIKTIFNQSMDTITVENALIITPNVYGRFEWRNHLTQMEFIPQSPLSPGVTYCVYLTDNEAKDVYGRTLDGDMDGEMGGEFSFTFHTKKVSEGLSKKPESQSIAPKVKRCFISSTLYNNPSNAQLFKFLFNRFFECP